MNGDQLFWTFVWVLAFAAFCAFLVTVFTAHNRGADRIQEARTACINAGNQWLDAPGPTRLCYGDSK